MSSSNLLLLGVMGGKMLVSYLSSPGWVQGMLAPAAGKFHV